MAQSYSAPNGDGIAASSATRRRVLVTGGAGRIGSHFARQSHERYELVLMAKEGDEAIERITGLGEIVTGDITDLEAMKSLCTGVDTVVHLAANASPITPWEKLLENNIQGTYNVFTAAAAAGCRRVIFASSIHAVSGYPPDVQVKTSEPVNPGDLYGVSKCFGEALGRYMATQEGLSVIVLRIGAFLSQEKLLTPKGIKHLDAWVSPRDLIQLIEKCIDDEALQFAIFHGLSNNRFKRLDISDATELVGYHPQDDSTEINPLVKDLHLKEVLPSHTKADS